MFLTHHRAKWVFKNIDEHIHSVCFAEDVDSFEQAASECIEFMFGPVRGKLLFPKHSSLIRDVTAYRP